MAPAQRRAQLLAFAIEVFADSGIGQARHAQIAERAGVSVSTVFVYFPTREALVTAVLDEVERELVQLTEDVFDRPGSVRARILDEIESFMDFVDTHPAHARVWLEWSTALREGLWPRYLAFQERIINIIADSLEHGRRTGEVASDIEPDGEARLLVASGHTLAQMKFAPHDPVKVARFIDTLLRSALGRRAVDDGAGER
jgi:TetR/AcrR family hemagglutinin/protease transcriptional regulator